MNADKKVNKQSEDEIQQAPAIPEDVSAVKKDQQKPPREKAGMDVAVGIAPRTPVAMNRRDIGGHHDQVQQVARASSGSATGTDVASGFVTPKTADQSPPKSDQISPVIPVVNYPSIHRRKKDGHYFLKALGMQEKMLRALLDKTEKLDKGIAGEDFSVINGQLNHLLATRFVELESMCYKALGASDNDGRVITNDDLMGFWDLLILQLRNVMERFDGMNVDDELKVMLHQWKGLKKKRDVDISHALTERPSTVSKPFIPTGNYRLTQRRNMLKEAKSRMMEKKEMIARRKSEGAIQNNEPDFLDFNKLKLDNDDGDVDMA
jgi:hypothetical protein